ncbi:peptidase, partial [Gardnerella vaginalis]
MINAKSGKHSRKVSLDAAVSNSIEKAVNARKVAAFTVGAAGVLAGAAFAFGATPAMAADADSSSVDPSSGKQDSTYDAYDSYGAYDANAYDTYNTDAYNTDAYDTSDNSTYDYNSENKKTLAAEEDRAGEEKKPNEVDFSKSMPNVYEWATPDNTFDTDLAKQEVVYHLPKPEDGKKIVRVVILPDSRDGINTDEEAAYKNLIEYDSERVDEMHQTYSGIYEFKKNPDGSADLIMKQPFRDAGISSGQGYCANRSIFLYYNEGDLNHNATSNNFRTATLVPPKVAKSIVLKYNERLSADTVRKMLHEAVNLSTDHKSGSSVADQIVSQSKSGGVGLRVDENTVNNTPDTVDAKIPESMGEYDGDMFSKINTKNGDDYALGSNTLNTYMVTDLGMKSPAIPLTVVRYDDRIEKLEVENPNNLTADDRNAIAKRVAEKNHIDASKVSVDSEGNATIKFDNLFQQNQPVISKDMLVMKKRVHLQDGDIELPSGENAVPVYNPIAYSKDDVARIKQAIFDANKNNSKLGLTSVDQITLNFYPKEELTVNKYDNRNGISNGLNENIITVNINTDKAVGSFKSDIQNSKITRFIDLRKDYDVQFTDTKLKGRDGDEGLEWSEDHKTLIYRYDSSLGSEFNTNDLIKMLKATPKGDLASKGLRNLDGSDRFNFSREGTKGKAKYSHINFFIDENNEPIGVLDIVSQTPKGANEPGLAVANSGEKMSESESKAGKYSFDKDSESVTVAAKEGKVYKARLFVDPYHPYYYMGVYDKGKNVYNTSKAINILFVPQTKNKKQDLIASVDKNKTLPDGTPTDPTYYNADPKLQKAYDDALAEAKKVSEEAKKKSDEDIKKNPELQAKIDNVTLKLDKARKDLNGDPTDKDPLKESVKEHGDDANSGTQSTDKYKNLDGDSFKTPDGKPDDAKNAKAKEAKKTYDDALAEAQKLVANPNATQKQVDAARDTLDKARKALDEFATDKAKLDESVNTNSGIDTGTKDDHSDADPRYQNATDEERKAYDDAVKKAADVAKDSNASQKEADTAADKLKEAKEALDKRETNKKLLDAQVQQSHDNDKADDLESASVFYRNAKKLKDGESLNGVDKNTALGYADAYDKALENANNVLKDPKATQKQVDDALDKLKKAEDDLHK